MHMKLIGKWARCTMAVLGVAMATAALASDGGAVLARLGNGETLTERDLSAYLERRIDLRQASRNAWGVQTVVREMALSRALALEGEAMGMQRRTGEEAGRFDDVYSHAVFKKMSPSCEPPADAAAARQFFDATPQAFRVPPMARLSRVMLPVSAAVEGEQAMDWLMLQAKVVASGGKTLDDVAERAAEVHKLDPQGDLGWVTLTDDATILRALANAKSGEMVGPVREGDFGYLFLVTAKRESRQLAWDEIAASVPSRAVRFCREQGSAQLQERLFKKYSVELDQAAIQNLFTRAGGKP